MLKLYQILSILAYPLIYLLLQLRVIKGKEDSIRYKEKLGFASILRPQGKLIWFHAASIGEFNAILPIIKQYDSYNILVTTVTLTAANIAKNNLPHNAIHQFMPLDSVVIVTRFLKHWQPDLVIWTESEFWPNILTLCKAEKLLINARLSQRSFTKWKLVPSLAKFMLSQFSLILTQSIETKALLEKLGAKNVAYEGNLKYVATNFTFNEQELQKLKLQTHNRIILMAASTHPGEEEIFADIHRHLKIKYPQLLTIIAPRHSHRIQDVMNLLDNLKVVLRSTGEVIDQKTDILLIDTIGEFGLFFRLTEIVATGGSWKKIAHSFIEPAKLGNLIIFGPNMNNSREVADEFLEKNAALYAKDELALEEYIEAYLQNPNNFALLRTNAQQTVEKMNQIQEKILEKLVIYINKL